MRQKTTKSLEKDVEDFNRRFPVGTEVMLKKDFEPIPVRTKTRSEAFVLSGHSAVVFLEGVSGCYLISHVSEAPTAPQSPLVEKVARVCARWRNGKKLAFPDFDALSEPEKAAYRDQAHAAIDACHAQELAVALRRMRREYGANMTVPGETLVLVDALLAKLDGQPTGRSA